MAPGGKSSQRRMKEAHERRQRDAAAAAAAEETGGTRATAASSDTVGTRATAASSDTGGTTGRLVPIPSLPETDDIPASSSSRGANVVGGVSEQTTNPLLCIRTKKTKDKDLDEVDMETVQQPENKNPLQRKIVTGSKTLYMKKKNGDKPLVVEYDEVHKGPTTKEWRTIMSRDIGSAVRSRVPMLKPTFMELEDDDREPFEDYLRDLYHLHASEIGMWTYIDKTAANTYREWKHECHVHYTEVSKETPEEFIHRPHEWEWLKTHFESDDFKKRSATNTLNRNNGKEKGTAMNHHSGTIPYSYRVVENMKKGHPAPFLQTVCDVYEADKNAQPRVAAMKRKMDEYMASHTEGSESDVTTTIPLEEQLSVLEEAMWDGKSGTRQRGLGNASRRAPKPRGGAHVSTRTSEEVDLLKSQVSDVTQRNEALEKRNEEMERVNSEIRKQNEEIQRKMREMEVVFNNFMSGQANVGEASPNVGSKSSYACNRENGDNVEENDEDLC